MGKSIRRLSIQLLAYNEQDPAAQLEQLARRQSDVLGNKLGKDGTSAREIPTRPLPYGSEGVASPTYVAQAPRSGEGSELGSTPRSNFAKPSATWEKEDTADATKEEKDLIET